jgi:hypothetical protein
MSPYLWFMLTGSNGGRVREAAQLQGEIWL